MISPGNSGIEQVDPRKRKGERRGEDKKRNTSKPAL
jgi:hypothetical protein